jgi:hypothetical protein
MIYIENVALTVDEFTAFLAKADKILESVRFAR